MKRRINGPKITKAKKPSIHPSGNAIRRAQNSQKTPTSDPTLNEQCHPIYTAQSSEDAPVTIPNVCAKTYCHRDGFTEMPTFVAAGLC